MSKKYVNGWNKYSIRVVHNNVSTLYTFTNKYQKLREYYEAIGDIVELPDGRKKKVVDYYNYEWVIDLSQYGEAEDILKFKDIENADNLGRDIYLTPHSDLYYREIKVHVALEKKELTTMPSFGGNYDAGNEGFSVTFVNAERIAEVITQNADWIPVISALVGEEY